MQLFTYNNNCDIQIKINTTNERIKNTIPVYLFLVILSPLALIISSLALTILSRPQAVRLGSMRVNLITLTIFEVILNLMIFITALLYLINLSNEKTYLYSAILELICFYFIGSTLCSRNWIITLIALARCVAITKPIISHTTCSHLFRPKWMATCTILCILISFILSIFRLFEIHIYICTHLNNEIRFKPNQDKYISKDLFFAYQSAIPITIVLITTIIMLIALFQHKSPNSLLLLSSTSSSSTSTNNRRILPKLQSHRHLSVNVHTIENKINHNPHSISTSKSIIYLTGTSIPTTVTTVNTTNKITNTTTTTTTVPTKLTTTTITNKPMDIISQKDSYNESSIQNNEIRKPILCKHESLLFIKHHYNQQNFQQKQSQYPHEQERQQQQVYLNEKRTQNQAKATRMISLLTIVFILFEAPIFFCVVFESYITKNHIKIVMNGLKALIVLDSCANVIIYLIMSKRFRQETIRLWKTARTHTRQVFTSQIECSS